MRNLLVAQRDLLCRLLGHNGGDDAGEQNHQHHAVKHLARHEHGAVGGGEAHAHHDDGNGSCRMGRGEAKHHVARRVEGQAEQEGRQVGGNGLARCAEQGDGKGHPQHAGVAEGEAHVDEHAHADEKIGYEEGVAYKLDAVHQRRHMGYVAVEDEAREEGAEDALKTYALAQDSTHEEHGHDEDKLHDGVAVTTQEPARELGYEDGEAATIDHKLGYEPQPEQHARLPVVRCYQGGKHHQRNQEREHGRSHAKGHARLALLAVTAHDGVGYEGVAGHEAAQEQRGDGGVAQQPL